MFTLIHAAAPISGFDKPKEGLFFSIAEFAPYRALGWASTEQNNADADAYLEALGRQELSA